MSISIPSEFVSGFEMINQLPVEKIEKISSTLLSIPAGTGPKDLNEILSANFPESDYTELFATIYSLGSILLHFDSSVDEISKVLNHALVTRLEQKSSEGNYDNLEQKLNLILRNGDNLKATFKAIELITDNKVIYKNSRIFSDIRLIFDENIKENTSNRKAVVIHNLKLETQNGIDSENYYFSLDSQDLYKMKELINRAIIKDNQIKSDYSNIEFIEFTD